MIIYFKFIMEKINCPPSFVAADKEKLSHHYVCGGERKTQFFILERERKHTSGTGAEGKRMSSRLHAQ